MKTPDENNVIFQLATDFINQTSEHIFLTGKAGTGKTTFLKHIRESTHKITVVAAPTGVAAINAGGVTLHSLFQLPFEPFLPGVSSASSRKTKFSFSKQKLDLIRQLELLIIDEVSMLRADTLDAIDATMRRIRQNPKPFGGVQMLYIGDLFQLPPVAKDDEWRLLRDYYPSTFFFHSHALSQTRPIYIELKKVYRQGDPVFVNLLNRVRNNIITSEDIQALNDRYIPNFSPPDEEKYITLTTHNYKADQINSRKLAEIQSKERVLKGEINGDFPDYALPTDMQLKLKEGAQIMFIKNDTDDPRRYYNGKIATVSRIVDDRLYVYIPELNSEIAVTKETWRNVRYSLNKESGEVEEEELGAFVQYPVKLAWAITIHKSQGLTFTKAIIDIGSSFAAGQAYVALSRCTTLDGIVLHSMIRPGCVMTDPYAINFSKGEKDQEELCNIFEEGKRKFWAERLLQYFDWKQMYLILRELEKLFDNKDPDEFVNVRQLLRDFRKEVYGLENVAIKFQKQLTSMIRQGDPDDISLLQDRCQKGILYFSGNVIEKILKP
ncbi:MAG: AAA family ATPase, partial [Dysgonamonadaceae bacterium]|nr:AAA family ATPase [Dysgonamonadaceae bacterium]